MTDKFMPAEAFHLSTMLQDELDARGWHLDDLALRMGKKKDFGVNRLTLDMIWSVHKVNCRAGDETLWRISQALGVSKQYLKNIEEGWLKWMNHNGLEDQIAPRNVTDEVNRGHPDNDNNPRKG